MTQRVVTIIERVGLIMFCCLCAVFFSVSVAAAAVSTTNSSTQTATQSNTEVVWISDVKKTKTVDTTSGVATYKTEFTVTANDTSIYIPTSTSVIGAIVWAIGGPSVAASSLSAMTAVQSNRYVVEEGESVTFVLTTATLSSSSEPIIAALRYSTTVAGGLVLVPFDKNAAPLPPTLPQPPVATTTPVQPTSTRPVATTTPVQPTSTKPVNPVCIPGTKNVKGISVGNLKQKKDCRPMTTGTTSSTGGDRPINIKPITSPGTGTSSLIAKPKLCSWLNKNYAEGTYRPTAQGVSGQSTNRLTPFICQSSEWRPLQSPLSGVGTTTKRGAVRGASLSVPERKLQLMELHNQLSMLMSEVSAPAKSGRVFKIGDSVITTDALKVRARGAGGLLGMQPAGAPGVIVSSWVNAGGRGWYKVDFATGIDGWVAASYLKAGVPLAAVTVNFSRHQATPAASTIVVTDGSTETISPLSYLIAVSSDASNTNVAIKKLAVSLTITGATFAEVIDSATLTINGADYSDVIFTSTNGNVTTLVFNIAEPIVIESENEVLAEVRLVLRDTVAQLSHDFTLQAQVSPTDRVLTDVTIDHALVTLAGSATGEIHTVVVTE